MMKDMKVFVTGACGQLGLDTVRELRKRGIDCIASDICTENKLLDVPYIRLDITDADAVEKCIVSIKPYAVIHCAAWTAVDAAEEPQNREKVYAINVNGTENLARACKTVDAKMLYISTDYVFDGTGEAPWKPDFARFSPLNYYGKTKLAGELSVSDILDKYFIVRTAWVFGQNGSNFVKTMLRVGRSHAQVRVVNDQIGTPTYTEDLAVLLVNMILTDKYGRYHATNSGGFISWYDYCVAIYQLAGIEAEVIPVTTQEYGLSLAKRPCNSRLDKSKLDEVGLAQLPDWKDALRRYIHQLHN